LAGPCQFGSVSRFMDKSYLDQIAFYSSIWTYPPDFRCVWPRVARPSVTPCALVKRPSWRAQRPVCWSPCRGLIPRRAIASVTRGCGSDMGCASHGGGGRLERFRCPRSRLARSSSHDRTQRPIADGCCSSPSASSRFSYCSSCPHPGRRKKVAAAASQPRLR